MHPRFFAEKIDLSDKLIAFDEATSRHIVQVLRMAEGEQVMVTNGKGILLTVVLDQANKKGAIGIVLAGHEIAPSKTRTGVAISLVKNASRFEWFLEKAAELGITEIFPLLCERTEKQHFRLDRMRSIVLSAMLQSQQSWLTRLHEPMNFSSFLKMAFFKNKFIAHCREGKDAINVAAISTADSSVILIGPEGDFSDNEIARAIGEGYLETSLGETRLRTETAGIVAATFMKIRTAGQ